MRPCLLSALTLAALLLAALLASGPARAQPARAAAPPDTAAASRKALPASARAAMLAPLTAEPSVSPQSRAPARPRFRDPKTSFLEPAPTYSPKRFWYGVGSAAALNGVVMIGLSSVWYDEDERGGFQFYSQSENVRGPNGEGGDGWLDDWHTFAQMDKFGHVWTSWHIARITGAYGRWAGLSPGKAGLFGGLVSTVFQTQIEISDGFSKAYGFSRTDALANAVGSAMGGLKVAYPERLDWLAAKYSYNPSPYYATQTTDVGGGLLGYFGNAIKDYDGATYWLTVRPKELLEGRARDVWPSWLALSAGYGADGLAHAISGRSYNDSPPDDDRPAGYGPYEHRREFYIGPDFDFLHSLDLPQPFRAAARFLSFVRLPAPALQLAPEVEWHWVLY